MRVNMGIINKKSITVNNFHQDTYVLVYNEKDWEGGMLNEMTLKTKSEFYDIASQLSSILFDIFDFYHQENIYIGPFIEASNYCHWKNIDDFNLVKDLKTQLKAKEYYSANTKEDKMLIENITEGNMNYLTQSCFYLPSEQILIQVGHHTAFIAYSKDLETLNNEFSGIIKNYSGWHCELTSFYGN